jgi:hypothetical protein
MMVTVADERQSPMRDSRRWRHYHHRRWDALGHTYFTGKVRYLTLKFPFDRKCSRSVPSIHWHDRGLQTTLSLNPPAWERSQLVTPHHSEPFGQKAALALRPNHRWCNRTP